MFILIQQAFYVMTNCFLYYPEGPWLEAGQLFDGTVLDGHGIGALAKALPKPLMLFMPMP